MRVQKKRLRRKGAILPLSAILLVGMFAFVAFAVDLGYLALVRTQLQSAADSAAMASTVDLLQSRLATPVLQPAEAQELGRTSAQYYVANNIIAGTTSNLVADDDILFGRLDLAAGAAATLSFADPTRFNATQVVVRRSADINGEVPLFFARVLGIDRGSSQATATAAYADNFMGFRAPGEGEENLQILPFTLDEETWNQLLAGNTSDSWAWNSATKKVTRGADGVLEASLYPQGTGAPGNRGTVDVGNPNNSTKDLSRQIREGVNAQDLSYLPGGILIPDEEGFIQLTGDTGMSVGIKDDLASIVGETRVIPIFSKVAGNGNNATYTIVHFVGIRVMAVNLTGNPADRYVVIQPANIQIDNGVIAPDGAPFSQFLFSKNVWLVR